GAGRRGRRRPEGPPARTAAVWAGCAKTEGPTVAFGRLVPKAGGPSNPGRLVSKLAGQAPFFFAPTSPKHHAHVLSSPPQSPKLAGVDGRVERFERISAMPTAGTGQLRTRPRAPASSLSAWSRVGCSERMPRRSGLL